MSKHYIVFERKFSDQKWWIASDYAVHVGHFTDKKSADQFADRLRNDRSAMQAHVAEVELPE